MKIDINFLNDRPLSYSSIKEFAKSPRHYINYLSQPRTASKEMNLGSMVHCLLLYPSSFPEQFAVAPDVDKRTKDGKALWDSFVSESEGKTVVSESEFNDANSIVDNVKESIEVKNIINECVSFEEEFKTTVEGLPFRGFVDGKGNSFILELKTMGDASPQNIIKEFYNRSYHIQAGLYSLHHNMPVVYIIAETKPPFNFYVAKCSDEYIKAGINQLMSLSKKFRDCMDLEAFNAGYTFNMDRQFVVDLPPWIK